MVHDSRFAHIRLLASNWSPIVSASTSPSMRRDYLSVQACRCDDLFRAPERADMYSKMLRHAVQEIALSSKQPIARVV